MRVSRIEFPAFSGIRCLMMPYVQGDVKSLPSRYAAYSDIVDSVFFRKGDIGFLTIDESVATQGKPHRGARAKTDRALHTEAGKLPNGESCWGGGGTWGGGVQVTLDSNVEILLANNLDDSCALWNSEHTNTSLDGDIGHESHLYPYEDAVLMKAGDVHRIGIFTPHESLPVRSTVNRQFLRIVSSGVHGREPYFTVNPLVPV